MKAIVLASLVCLVSPPVFAAAIVKTSLARRIGYRLLPTRVSQDSDGIHVRTYGIEGGVATVLREKVQYRNGKQETREQRYDAQFRRLTLVTTIAANGRASARGIGKGGGLIGGSKRSYETRYKPMSLVRERLKAWLFSPLGRLVGMTGTFAVAGTTGFMPWKDALGFVAAGAVPFSLVNFLPDGPRYYARGDI